MLYMKGNIRTIGQSVLPYSIFALVCISSLFATSIHFNDQQTMPKWLIMSGGVIILSIYFCVRSLVIPDLSKRNVELSTTIIGGIIITSTSLQALYGIAQYFDIFLSNNLFKVTGSFDNPAGFAASLCIAFPFYILIISKSQHTLRWIEIFLTVVTALAVILSESRSGMLSLLVIILCQGIQRWKLSMNKKIIIFVLVSLVTICGLFFIKKDSANGRLLIWKCALPMLEQNWLTGYGTGGFEAHYMDYQAAYFEKYPEDPYGILADNVQYPFCEYLRIAIDYGIIGILFLSGWLLYLLFCYFRYPSATSKIALLCWITICTFSCFSYPLMYPFVWLVLIYSTFILIRKHIQYIFKHCPPILLKTATASYVIFSIYAGCKIYTRMQAEIEWVQIANLSSIGKTKNVLPQYEKLMKVLGKDRYFLYNYSAELFHVKYYRKSLDMAMKCRKYWADYDLEMLLGEIQYNLKCYDQAKSHYQQASLMCPNRFMPLYKLYKLYKEMGDTDNAKRMAHVIVDKPVKIDSPLIKQIKSLLSH